MGVEVPIYIPTGIEDNVHTTVPYIDDMGNQHFADAVEIKYDDENSIVFRLLPCRKNNYNFILLNELYRRIGKEKWLNLVDYMDRHIFRPTYPSEEQERNDTSLVLDGNTNYNNEFIEQYYEALN